MMVSREHELSHENMSKADNQSDENTEPPCSLSTLENKMTDVNALPRKMKCRPKICHAKSYSLLRLFIEHVGIPSTRSCYKLQPHRHAIDTKLMNWLLLDVACSKNTSGISDCWIMLRKKLKWLLPILQQCNGDVNFADRHGQTVVHIFLKKYGGVLDTCLPRDNLVKTSRLIKTLLEQGASVNVEDKQGNTPMHFAAEHKIKPLIMMLIDSFTNVNAQNSEGNTVLHILADSYGTTESFKQIVCTLLSKSADINMRNNEGNTPVHFAAKHCQLETLGIFKKHKADFSALGERGKTMLHFVSASCLRDSKDDVKRMKTIDFFVNEGCDVNATDKEGFTALHYAATCNGSSRLIKKLIKLGVDVKCRTNNFETPLHMAVRCDCATIETLLNVGVDVNAMSAGGIAPLHDTIFHGSLKNMDCLIRNGADIHLGGTIFDLTPVHMTALACKRKLELLVSKGAKVNVRNSKGITPLHLAAMMGNLEVLEALIEHGADMHCRDEILASTPLHWAAMKGGNLDVNVFIDDEKQTKEREDIVEHWKSLFAQAYKNQSTLDDLQNSTVPQRKCEVIETLLTRGALMGIKDNKGRVPLFYVLENNNFEGVKSLLKRGVDINDQTISKKVVSSKNEDIRNHVLWHAMKLKQINFPISSVYKFRTYHTDYWGEYRKCLEEVEALKSQKIDESNVSLYDFVHMNASSRLAFLKSALSCDLEFKFPWYCDIIMSKCREAVERKSLLETAIVVVRQFSDLPDLCIKRLLSYLNNEALRALIYSAKST